MDNWPDKANKDTAYYLVAYALAHRGDIEHALHLAEKSRMLQPPARCSKKGKGKKQDGGRGGCRNAPYVFTEHGAAILASVLRSPRAIHTGLAIVRTFVRLRERLATHSELVARLKRLEGNQDRAVSVIEALVTDIERLSAEIDEMTALPEGTARRIGFVTS